MQFSSGGGGGGGELQYKNDGGARQYILRVKFCRLAPLSVLKSKMTKTRIFAEPFRVLSRKNMTEYVLCC